MTNQTQYSAGYAQHTLNEFSKRSMQKEGRFFNEYIKKGQTVLDVGCGPGSLSIQLAEMVSSSGFVQAVDVQSEQFPTAHAGNIQFQQASIFQLPFADETFDTILAHAVLYHLNDQHRALLELKRVLKSGGLLGIRDADFGGDVCYPAVEGLHQAWDIAEACFDAAGSDIYFGRKQSSSLTKAGFEILSLSASYDIFCHASGYSPQGFALFWQNYIQRHRDKTGYSKKEIDQASSAIERWGNHPDAYYGRTRCEAVGRKSSSTTPP